MALHGSAVTDDEETVLMQTTFQAEIQPSEAGQVVFWSRAQTEDWGRLGDPAGAVGLRMAINPSSVVTVRS